MKTRWRAEAAIAVLLAAALAIVGARVIWVATTKPIYEDAAAVPSAVAAAPAAKYAGPVAETRQRARTLVSGANLPGLSIAVAMDGAVVWAEGFGWADVDQHIPVTPLTSFRLGALSKPFAAMAAARLYDEGRLDLDAPVQKYIPAYPKKQWTVTTRQLLGDVGGVHRIRGDGNDAMPTNHCTSLDEAVGMLEGDPLQFEPGTQHRYSIWGWVLVSGIIQGAAGEPFDRAMAREVFRPLAMEHTTVSEIPAPDVASSEYAPRTIVTNPLDDDDWSPPEYSCLFGAGAFVSTPTDLVRLGSAVLKPGFLKAETMAAFQTPTRLASGAAATYAMGWTVGSVQLAGQPTRMVSHRGNPRGGATALLTFPDLGIAVAVTASGPSSFPLVDSFARQVAEAFNTVRGQR